jgi:hypothetical protein
MVGFVLAAGPALAAPSVSASPSTGLNNGDHVTVTISGFPASDSLAALECNPDPSIPQDGSGCNIGGIKFFTANANGGGSATVTVKTGQIGSSAKSMCPPTAAQKAAGVTHCIIAVSEPSTSSTVRATADIIFASEASGPSPTPSASTHPTQSPAGSGSSGSSGSSSGSSSSGSSSSSGNTSDTQVKGAKHTKTSQNLPFTGPSTSVLVMVAIGIALADVGYLMVSATRRPRRTRT